MDWQEIVALSLVAGVWLLWVAGLIRRHLAGARCGSVCRCGCAPESSSRPARVVVSGQRGERPVVTVKMK